MLGCVQTSRGSHVILSSKPLQIRSFAQNVFCRVVLRVSVWLLSVQDNHLVPVCVGLLIVWRTLHNDSGTLQCPRHETWPGTGGTAAPTGPGSCSSWGLLSLPPPVLLLQPRAVSGPQLWPSIRALTSPCVAWRLSCVLCARNTPEPHLCSLCLLPAEVKDVRC